MPDSTLSHPTLDLRPVFHLLTNAVTTPTARVGQYLKERLSFPDPGTHAAVERWLAERHDFEGPLFLPVKKSGEINYQNGRISDQAIYNIVKKRQKQAGVQACALHEAYTSLLVTQKIERLRLLQQEPLPILIGSI